MTCVCDSISTFTVSPTVLSPSTVTRSVSGINHTLNRPVFLSTSPTVRLHPSMEMNPFGNTYLINVVSLTSKTTFLLCSLSTTSTTSAVQCTCPLTVCSLSTTSTTSA